MTLLTQVRHLVLSALAANCRPYCQERRNVPDCRSHATSADSHWSAIPSPAPPLWLQPHAVVKTFFINPLIFNGLNPRKWPNPRRRVNRSSPIRPWFEPFSSFLVG